MKIDLDGSFSIVDLSSILLFALGTIDILSALFGRPRMHFETVRLGIALIGFAFIVLSGAIRRRKKVAWYVGIIFLITNFILRLIRGGDFDELIIPVLMIVLLFSQRKKFVAKVDKPSIYSGIKALVFSLIFTLFYGTVGLYIFEHHGRVDFSLLKALKLVFELFILQPTVPFFVSKGAYIFYDTIYMIGFSSFIYSVLVIFRSVSANYLSSETDQNKADTILKEFGDTPSLIPPTLFQKSYFFNKKTDSFLAYKTLGGYAISLGGPVGKNKSDVLKEYLLFCKENGWLPIFSGISKNKLSIFNEHKFKFLEISQEAVIDLQRYDFSGEKKRPLRYSQNIMPKKGYQFNTISNQESQKLLKEIEKISAVWLKNRKLKELHFSIGSFDRKYIHKGFLFYINNPKGKIVAFANAYNFGKNKLSIDLMRHLDNIPPDTMLYLFSSIITWAKENGYTILSIGAASKPDTGNKTLNFFFNRINKFYNFKGLYVFKSKFQPLWEPNYIVYPSPVDLSGALTVLIRAELGK